MSRLTAALAAAVSTPASLPICPLPLQRLSRGGGTKGKGFDVGLSEGDDVLTILEVCGGGDRVWRRDRCHGAKATGRHEDINHPLPSARDPSAPLPVARRRRGTMRPRASAYVSDADVLAAPILTRVCVSHRGAGDHRRGYTYCTLERDPGTPVWPPST